MFPSFVYYEKLTLNTKNFRIIKNILLLKKKSGNFD